MSLMYVFNTSLFFQKQTYAIGAMNMQTTSVHGTPVIFLLPGGWGRQYCNPRDNTYACQVHIPASYLPTLALSLCSTPRKNSSVPDQTRTLDASSRPPFGEKPNFIQVTLAYV